LIQIILTSSLGSFIPIFIFRRAVAVGEIAAADAVAAAAANGTCWEAVQAFFGPVIECFWTCFLGCCLST